MELRKDDLVLRPFKDGDVSGIVEACCDEDTARFVPHIPSPYTEEDARRYVDETREWATSGERIPLAIADAETDALLGAIDVRLGDEGSIGYWIAPGARNRGVATRALEALSRWAVYEAGVRRLLLTTHPDNRASQRVAEKAGFHSTGIVERHLRFRDGTDQVVVFELQACLACDLAAGRTDLPGGVIHETPRWVVEHCIGPLGVGTLIVKPKRHIVYVSELDEGESEELGPLLRHVAAAVQELTEADQVYVGLWSHAGRRPVHIHFVVQPVTPALMDEIGDHGPHLQAAMFDRGESPPRDEVEAFAQAARAFLAP
jgi:RimJ/RimL family protein N-acetyltransferase/diadenosine tetraphosphate (Ap4A) HIT family hydrolase